MKLTNKVLNDAYDQYEVDVKENLVELEKTRNPAKKDKTIKKRIFRKKVKEWAENIAKARGHKSVHKRDLNDAINKFIHSSIYNPNLTGPDASDYAFRKALYESGLPIRFRDNKGRYMSIFDKAIIIEYEGTGEDARGKYRQYCLHTNTYYYVVREYQSESEDLAGGVFDLIGQGPWSLYY